MDVKRHQRALPGAAARDHEIHGLAVEQHAGLNAEVNIGQMVILFIAHTDVEDLVAQRLCDAFQFFQHGNVFSGLAVFHH